ncbi:MAG: ATP-binding cassette domain-containing protein [Chitinophagales bacterium]|nr:ATP-binding cassette domain-containing protein [Chitinophagales bacterium]
MEADVSVIKPTIIQIKDAAIFQNKHLVLDDVNFEARVGDFIYLVGRTGQGKSSLLKTLYGDLPLQKGDGMVCGYDLKQLNKKTIPFFRRKIGIVFQDFQLLQDRTIYDNLSFVLKAVGITSEPIIKQKIDEALTLVKLPHKEQNYPSQLSGGEQQRIAIARALINHPELILADEPTGNLDPETSDEIMELFYNIFKEQQTPVVMATHNYQLIEKFKGIIYMCANGIVSKDESYVVVK